jgi:ATP-dependent DNA helicase PIF1
MSILPRYQEWKDARTAKERMRIARDSVRDNPLIVAYHFERRYEAFFKEVLKPKFHITDYWNRYEWQDRGSI